MSSLALFLYVLGGASVLTTAVGAVMYNANPNFKNWIDGGWKNFKKWWYSHVPGHEDNPGYEAAYKAERSQPNFNAGSPTPFNNPGLNHSTVTTGATTSPDHAQQHTDDDLEEKTHSAATPDENTPQARVRRKGNGMTWREWFAVFAGTPLGLYRQAPEPVQHKRTALGVAVFTVLSVSSLFFGIAAGSVFENAFIGIAIGLVWFFLIRAIEVSFMIAFDSEWAAQIEEKKESKRLTMRMAPAVSMRLLITFVIGTIITIFITMLFYSKEIQVKVGQMKDGKISQSMADMNKRIEPLEAQKAVFQKRYDDLLAQRQSEIDAQRQRIANQAQLLKDRQDSLIGEIEGIVGTHIPGDRAAAAEKRAALKRDSVALEQQRSDLDSFISHPDAAIATALATRDTNVIPINKQIDQIRAEQAQTAKRFLGQKMDGFNDRYIAMKQIAAETPLYKYFFCLLLAIEMMCLILKITLGPDFITRLIALENEKAKVDKINTQQMDLMDKQLDHEYNMGEKFTTLMDNRIAVQNNINERQKDLHDAFMTQYEGVNMSLAELEEVLNKSGRLSDAEKNIILDTAKKGYLMNGGSQTTPRRLNSGS